MNCPFHILIYKDSAALLSRSAGAPGRAGHRLSLRALGRDARPAARARLYPGRRAHLLHAGADRRARSAAASTSPSAMLDTYGFDEYQVELSTWDPNDRNHYIGSDEQWELAENSLKKVLGRADSLQVDSRRGRILRAEDRRQAGGRHRPAVAALHRAVRLQPAAALRDWSTWARMASAISR